MSGRGPLALPCDLVYRYDGGLQGFYTCVHESVYLHQLPVDIQPEHEAQPTLLPERWIDTDPQKAARVRAAIGTKISPRAQELVETVFLSCLAQKELCILRFLLLAFGEGARVTTMLDHPDVMPLVRAEGALLHENHLLTGFTRFSDVDGKLIATILPKNFVLPLLASHFVARFPNEDFMIYDRTHRAAALYERGRGRILQLAEIGPIPVSEGEAQYRALWKQFYETFAIDARYNPKCRMTHLPKRYWSEMTEMKDLL